MRVRIAKPGKDALNGPIEDMSMTSEANSLKVHAEGTWSQAVVAGNSYTVTIPHGLSYAPCFRVSGQHDPADVVRYIYPSAVAIAYITATVYTDVTNLYIKLQAGGLTTTGTLTGYYYIFEDNV
jgi:hypothetical protein